MRLRLIRPTDWSFSALLQVGMSVDDDTIYGSLPANQMVAAGSYGDTITVTLEY